MPIAVIKGELKHIPFNAKHIAFLINTGVEVQPDKNTPDAEFKRESKQVQEALSKLRSNLAKRNAYLVGEDGPEIFVPDRRGKIIPNPASSLKLAGARAMGGIVDPLEKTTAIGTPAPGIPTATPAPFQQTWVEKRDQETKAQQNPTAVPVQPTVGTAPTEQPWQETWIDQRARETKAQQGATVAPVTPVAANTTNAVATNVISYDSLQRNQALRPRKDVISYDSLKRAQEARRLPMATRAPSAAPVQSPVLAGSSTPILGQVNPLVWPGS